MQPYVVYNVLTKLDSDVVKIHTSLHNEETADLFQVKDEIINIEHFTTPNLDKLEFRFTFRSRDDHFAWIERNKERYDAHVEKYSNHWKANGVRWDRYTSDDYYISEFVGQSYKTLKNLIDWQLTDQQKNNIVKHLAPLGTYRYYVGNGEWKTDNSFDGARFMKERHSNIRRFGNSPMAHKDYNFPAGMMAYHFDHAIDVLQYGDHDLFVKLKKLCYDVEELASNYITACNYAATILGHKNLGHHFKVHSHRLDDYNRHTFTIIARLSKTDKEDAVFRGWHPYPDNDPKLPYYYAAPWEITSYVEKSQSVDIPINTDTSLLVFNASYCPHSVVWSDDVYLFFVYDHVTWKEGVFEKMIQKSEHCHYADQGKDKILLYHGIK
jgi:hypothetical protein